MRLYKMFGVWMFEKQTEEERRRSYLGDNREYWFALSNESLSHWSISVCKSFKQNQVVFLYALQFVWSLNVWESNRGGGREVIFARDNKEYWCALSKWKP
jgi:hypothetical protein